ncbi:F-box domain-containing protein [Mycena sanguinolenta]|uniref:F-box domain-containing protein n=1 Tax=Mycena sanguinolenta TaxID=230812 RepID=A0A8H7CLX8_9AGAR|nr:F-box domain-containing protein [Mycena sanguinolenta]
MPSLCSACGAPVIASDNDIEGSLSTAPTDPQMRVRFLELSKTNEPPRDDELSLIQPFVHQTSARLTNLDAQISRLKDRLHRLQEERRTLSKDHARNLGIVSALRRMPPELLGEIFSWTVPSTRDVLSTRLCPWVLTHVCSGWRAVALAIPSLWSMIYIDFELKQEYPLEMVRTQLARAQLLKVHFCGTEVTDPSPQITMFELLAQHSARWQELSLQLTCDLGLRTVNLDFASLRRAWVQWDTMESQPPELRSIEFFSTATSLVDIGVLCEYRFLPTRLPAPHLLTRYDFDAPWETHRQLLKSSPNLREVRIIRDFDQDEDWPELGELVDLQHLRRLYVNDPSCLDYLKAPNLEEIGIGIIAEADTTETCRSLERFLTRSSCSPRRLCIHGLLDAQSMAAILRKYCSFTEIMVTDEGEEDVATQEEILSVFFTLFTISDSTQPEMVLPHITEIGFACEDADDSLLPLFADMVDSRWRKGALKAAELVCIETPPNPNQGAQENLEMLREEGLHISILSGDDANDRIERWLLRSAWT